MTNHRTALVSIFAGLSLLLLVLTPAVVLRCRDRAGMNSAKVVACQTLHPTSDTAPWLDARPDGFSHVLWSDGRSDEVYGYSLSEDSPIYNRPGCDRPAHHG